MSWRQGFRQLANAAKRASRSSHCAVGGTGASQLRTYNPGKSSGGWSSSGCLALAGAAASIGFAPVAFAGTLDEQSFIMIKPDGVQRSLIAEIIARFERKGYKLVAIKVLQPSEDLAKQHYAEHDGKPFFAGLVDFLVSGPVVAMVWEGKEVINTGRGLIGVTNPLASAPGTIRGDFGVEIGRNLIHGSDGVDSAQKEIALWFKPSELTQYKPTIQSWIYEAKM